jgi:hypothetical protein
MVVLAIEASDSFPRKLRIVKGDVRQTINRYAVTLCREDGVYRLGREGESRSLDFEVLIGGGIFLS